jgi:phospholipid transport system substrate-binding protein
VKSAPPAFDERRGAVHNPRRDSRGRHGFAGFAAYSLPPDQRWTVPMTVDATDAFSPAPGAAPRGLQRPLIALLGVLMTLLATIAPATAAADPAVLYMERVAKELMAAARSQSPAALNAVITRHADLGGIGLYALGDSRPKLDPADKPGYLAGMTRFIARYAAGEAPKYPIAKVSFVQESRQAKYGVTVDSTVTLQDGSSYEVAWLLVGGGNSYRVRDAQVLNFWMTPFLKKLFEDYIAQNNGNVKALVAVLARQ